MVYIHTNKWFYIHVASGIYNKLFSILFSLLQHLSHAIMSHHKNVLADQKANHIKGYHHLTASIAIKLTINQVIFDI